MTITEIVRSVLERVKLFVDRRFIEFNSTHANWTDDNENSIQFIKNKPAALPANGGNATTVDELSFTEVSTDVYVSLGSMENSFQDKIYILDKPIDGENSGIIIKPDPEEPENPEEPEIIETVINLTEPYYVNRTYRTLSKNSISVYPGDYSSEPLISYRQTVSPNKSYNFSCKCDQSNATIDVYTVDAGYIKEYYFSGNSPVNVEIPAGSSTIGINFMPVSSETEVIFSEISLIEKN